jgi:hypothetical protein
MDYVTVTCANKCVAWPKDGKAKVETKCDLIAYLTRNVAISASESPMMAYSPGVNTLFGRSSI